MFDLKTLASRIASAHTLEGLDTILREWLPRLGITSYALSLACDAKGKPHALHPESSYTTFFPSMPTLHRLFSSIPGLTSNMPVLFDPSDLAPAAWFEQLPRTTLIVVPLTMGGTWYGHALMTPCAETNLVCQSVQELISGFLVREHSMRELLRRNTDARINAHMELEKMQAMGTLIAGFAHDLATPIGISQTTAGFLADGLVSVKTAFEGGALGKNAMEQFLKDSEDAVAILKSSTERARELVANFKRISIEVPRDDIRHIAITVFLRDILKNLRPLWRRRAIQIHFEGDETLEATTRASPFLDILTNLIQNSLVHAFPGNAGGNIRVSINPHPENPSECLFEFVDDGAGIDDKHIDQIFEPFFTTREDQGGTGLGLHIVQQRVQTLLAGSIRCTSAPGRGTTFSIRFPRLLAG